MTMRGGAALQHAHIGTCAGVVQTCHCATPTQVQTVVTVEVVGIDHGVATGEHALMLQASFGFENKSFKKASTHGKETQPKRRLQLNTTRGGGRP